MKKTLSIILIALLSLSLISCNKNTGDVAGNSDNKMENNTAQDNNETSKVKTIEEVKKYLKMNDTPYLM